MLRTLEKPIIAVPLLLVLAIYLYFFQLDKIALTDPDETFYAQTAKEMLRKGEWLTPILYGKPQFEKPILFYSFVEASYKLFGVNEFAARFPSALFGTIGLLAMYFLGRLLFSSRAGLFSAIVLATNIEYIMLSIGCVTDMMLTVFLLLGVLFFFYAHIKKKDIFYVLSAAAFAFAVLTKGPIFVLLSVFILALYLIIIKDFEPFKKYGTLIWSVIVFIIIAAPWYILMYKLHGNSFIDEFFGFHNVTRFLTPEHKTGSQVYYNIPIILGGFMPWSAFLPLGFVHIFKNCEKNKSVFIYLWFLVIFIFFTVSSTKLPTYVFPCFISLALMIGKLWDDFLSGQGGKALSSGMKYSYYLLLAVIFLALIGGYIFLKMDYPDIVPSALVVALFLVLGLAISLAAFMAKKFMAVFFLIAYTIALAMYPLTTAVLPYINYYETEKPVSEAIALMYKEGDIIGGERDFRAGLAFYTDKLPIHEVTNATLAQLLGSGKKAWCVIKKKNVVKDLNIIYISGEKRLVTDRSGKRK